MPYDGESERGPGVDENDEAAPASGGRLLRQNPGFVLTVAYLCLTAIGAFYNWRLCARFGVGVFDLADASDFLMFAVRDLMVVFFALFPVVLFGTVFAWFVRAASVPKAERRGPARLLCKEKPDVRGSAVVCVVAAVFYVFYFLNGYSGTVARQIRAGEGRSVAYVLAGDANAAPQAAQLVTATARYVVVYRPGDGTTQVIPVESLARLVF